MRSTKDDFNFDKQVGTGTYGIVWQTRRKQDGKTYAVKELDLRYLEKQVVVSLDVHSRHTEPAPHSMPDAVHGRSKQHVFRKSKCCQA